MSDANKILFVCSQSPGQGNLAREALDACFATAAFEQTVSVYFYGDAVWQLLKGQGNNPSTGKNISQSWQAAELYDITGLYVCQQSAAQRGLTSQDLIDSVTLIPTAQAQALMASQHSILSF